MHMLQLLTPTEIKEVRIGEHIDKSSYSVLPEFYLKETPSRI